MQRHGYERTWTLTDCIPLHFRQTRVQASLATLDVEPRRLTLVVPNLPSKNANVPVPPWTLDVDLTLPDAQLVALHGVGGAADADSDGNEGGGGGALMLKRQREFDVEGARAEWDVKAGRMSVWV